MSAGGDDANVNIVVRAVTEAAEAALDNVGDELNNLAADSQPAQSAMSEVGDQMNDAASSSAVAAQAFEDAGGDAAQLAAALRLVQSQADEAGDELSQAGRRATVTGGLFSTLTVSTEGLAVSFGSLSTVLNVTLLPALVLLSTILAPLAATLGAVAAAVGGLAAGFGAVVAVPIATHMKEVKSAIQEAGQEILSILQPLGDRFLPLILDAIDALPTLVRNVLDAAGGLEGFAQTLRELGNRAMTAIPELAALLLDMGRNALPTVIDAADWLMANGGAIFAEMRSTAEEVGPLLLDIGEAFVEALPAINEFGTILLEDIAPALATAVSGFGDLLSALQGKDVEGTFSGLSNVVQQLAPRFRRLMDAVRNLMPFLIRMARPTLRVLGAALVAVVEGVTRLIRWFNSLPGVVKTGIFIAAAAAVAVLSGGLLGVVAAVAAAANAWPLLVDAVNWAQQQINNAITFLEGVWNDLKATVRNVVNDIVAGVRSVASDIVAAFTGLVNWLTNTLPGLVADAMVLIGIALLTLVTDVETAKDVVRGLADAWDWLKARAQDAIDAVQGVIGDVVSAAEGVAADVRTAFEDVVAVIQDVIGGVAEFFSPIITFLTTTFPAQVVVALSQLLGTARSILNDVRNVFVSIFNGIVGLATTAMQGLLNTVLGALNEWLAEMDEVAGTVENLTGRSLPDIGRVEIPELQASALQAERQQVSSRQASRRTARNIGVTIGLDVRGDNPLADFLRENVQEQVDGLTEEQRRRMDRQGIGSAGGIGQ